MDSEPKQSWIDLLTKAARTGVVLDLAPDLNDETLVGSFDTDFPSDRFVPAEALRTVLLDPDLHPDPRGLCVRGARIEGVVDLSHASVPCCFGLICCLIPAGLDMGNARLPNLVLTGSQCGGIDLNDIQIEGGMLAQNLTTQGEVRAMRARIASQVYLRGATLTNPDGHALNLDGSQIDGGLFAPNLDVQGEVRAVGAHIAAQIDFRGAKIINPDGSALNLDGSQLDGGLFAEALITQGEVRAVRAQIGGQLDFRRGNLSNPDGYALGMDGSKIDGTVYAHDLTTQGGFRALGAHFRGQIELVRANFINPDGDALALGGSQIDADIFAPNFTAEGTVSMMGTTISGLLGLPEASLTNLNGDALNLDASRIGAGVFLQDLEAQGEVRAVAAHIDRYFGLERAVLINPEGQALNLDGCKIDGNVFAHDLVAQGEVRAAAVHISLQLGLERVTLANAAGVALNLQDSFVNGLFLRDNVRISGIISLCGANIGKFVTDEKCPKPQSSLGILAVDGWHIDDAQGWLRNDIDAVERWLSPSSRTMDFMPQPWHEFATLYDRIGHTTGARRLRYDATRHIANRQPQRVQGIQFFYRWLVGYGYYPLRTAWWFIAAFIVALLIISTNTSSFVPTNLSSARVAYTSPNNFEGLDDSATKITGATPCNALNSQYPCLQPWSYAAATVTPASALQVPAWSPSAPWIEAILMAFKFLGWILTAFLLAGLTGLLRKP